MQKIVIIFLVVLLSFEVNAQPPLIKFRDKKNIAGTIAVHLPVGDFSKTHFGGISLEAARVRYQAINYRLYKLHFTYEGGVAYYFGKKETVSGYPYKYPGYFFIHGFAGGYWVPRQRIGLALTAGPGLGIYNGNTRFAIGAKLDGTFLIDQKHGVGPRIMLMKESGVDAIWTAGVKFTKLF